MTRGARSFIVSALLYHISEGSTERSTSRNVKLRLNQSNSLGFHSLAGRNKGRKRVWVKGDSQRPKPSDRLASILPSPAGSFSSLVFDGRSGIPAGENV